MKKLIQSMEPSSMPSTESLTSINRVRAQPILNCRSIVLRPQTGIKRSLLLRSSPRVAARLTSNQERVQMCWLGEWYGQLCSASHTSAQQFEGESVGVARRIAAEQRTCNLNERTFLNNLTPTTESHHLKLEESWRPLDGTRAKHPVHVVARQVNQLVAPIPDPEAVSISALFSAFSLRKREITETQEFVYPVLKRKRPFSSIAARLYHCTQAVAEFVVNYGDGLIHDSDGRFLEALLESLGCKSYPLPALTWQPTQSNLMDSYSDLEQRQADTIPRIRGTLDDGVVTADELKGIREELEKEYQAEVTLVMSLPVIHSISEP